MKHVPLRTALWVAFLSLPVPALGAAPPVRTGEFFAPSVGRTLKYNK